jgi:bifunctional DNA-binding transcriptional regulator/antitoxin component of YhaV-PrlF toxin-antitoxin module
VSATIVREKRQTTVPQDVAEAASIRPGDQLDWTFENGEIRVRKMTQAEVETLDELPRKMGRISNASIRAAVRAGRR